MAAQRGARCLLRTPQASLVQDLVVAEAAWKDMIVAFSTVRGYVSWRHSERGSWYIETLCQVFMNHSHEASLRRMLDMISERLEDKESARGGKQQATYTVRR